MLQPSSGLKCNVSLRIRKGKSFKPDPASNEAFLKGSGKQDASNQLQPQMKRFFNAHAKLICIEFISNYFLHNLVPAQKPYARTNCVNINEYVFLQFMNSYILWQVLEGIPHNTLICYYRLLECLLDPILRARGDAFQTLFFPCTYIYIEIDRQIDREREKIMEAFVTPLT